MKAMMRFLVIAMLAGLQLAAVPQANQTSRDEIYVYETNGAKSITRTLRAYETAAADTSLPAVQITPTASAPCSCYVVPDVTISGARRRDSRWDVYSIAGADMLIYLGMFFRGSEAQVGASDSASVQSGQLYSVHIADTTIANVDLANDAVDNRVLANDAVASVNVIAGAIDSTDAGNAKLSGNDLALKGVAHASGDLIVWSRVSGMFNRAAIPSLYVTGPMLYSTIDALTKALYIQNIYGPTSATTDSLAGRWLARVGTLQVGTATIIGNVKLRNGGNLQFRHGAGGAYGVNLLANGLSTALYDLKFPTTQPTTGEFLYASSAGQISATTTTVPDSARVAAGAITRTRIASGSVTAVQIMDGQVKSAELAAGAVADSAKIATGAVTVTKIGSNAVYSTSIKDAQVKTADLAASSVDSTKIAAAHVPVSKIKASDSPANAEMLTYTSGDFEWRAQSADFSMSCGGKPTTAEVLLRIPMVRAVTFPDNFSGSQGVTGTNATGSSAWSIKKNGTEIGTCTFSSAGATGTFTTAGATAETFAAGDVLTIVAPVSVDATMADIGIQLKGTKGD